MTSASEFAVPPSQQVPLVRDGNRLIVPRGADFSGCCLQCAGAPAGKPIVKHLAVDKSALFGRGTVMSSGGTAGWIMFVLDLLLLLTWLVWLVVDWSETRRRRVSFSLCTAHRRRRLLFRWLTLAGLPIGIALLLMGIFGNQPDEWDLLPFVPGCILIFCGLMSLAFNPDPKLAAENEQFLWLKNIGDPFLARHPQQGS